MRNKLALVACAALAAVAVLFVGTPARAQLPPTPQLPRFDLPEPVADVVIQGIDTVVPIVGQTALQLRPVATIGGFALRMPCAALGGASFVLALGSSIVVLPVPTGVFIGPPLVFCSGAFEDGPADPLFMQVDGAAGDMLEEQTTPVTDQLVTALAPTQTQLDEGCGVLRIFGSVPNQAPPPLHRYNWVSLICG